MTSLVPVTVVIHTLNEERNLPQALRSVRHWADEILVCDMHSDDSTVEIAKRFGARICLHERVGFADPARAFAISQARHDWILVLDADELIPFPLAKVLTNVIADDRADICWIPRQNYLLGEPIEGMGWGADEDAQLRLFRRDAVVVTADIHRFFHVAPGARELRLSSQKHGAIIHFNYIDISQFIDKLNRYSSIEATQADGLGKSASLPLAIAIACREVIRRFVLGGGYRMGWRGACLTLLMVGYRLAVQAKLVELRAGNTRESVVSHYRNQAESYLRVWDSDGRHELDRSP
jgi:glycosyltransferase involved in cell wall biosynthesis